MAYEFIASGIRPAKPLSSFMEGMSAGTQFQQNKAINQVNIQGGKIRNEAADIALTSAKNQVQAEKAWAAIPVNEDGTRDEAAVAAVAKISPEYVRTQKTAEIQLRRDELSSTVDQITTASFFISKAKTPEELTAASNMVKEITGVDVSKDQAGLLGFTTAAKQYADEAAGWDEALKNAKTPEEARNIKQHADAAGNLAKAQLSLLIAQGESARTASIANLARANASGIIAARGDKPASGYRWKPDGSQEPIPGGPAAIKLGAQKEKEVSAMSTMNSIADAEIRNIDKLIGSEDGKTKEHPGLKSMVGSIDPYVPTVLTSTKNAEALLQSLQSKASISALRDIRSGGSQSIGQITEREWPRLENLKATLQQTQGTEQFRESLKEYRNELLQMKRDASGEMESFLKQQSNPDQPEKTAPSEMSDAALLDALGL